jgi:hypothetical protein
LNEIRNLPVLAVQRRASPHEVRVARKEAFPGFAAVNFQTIVPQPIPGNWQFAGAVGPGIIAVIVGVSLPTKLEIDFSFQKVECKVISIVEPDLIEKVLLFPDSEIFRTVAALDWAELDIKSAIDNNVNAIFRGFLRINYLMAQLPDHE